VRPQGLAVLGDRSMFRMPIRNFGSYESIVSRLVQVPRLQVTARRPRGSETGRAVS
jgi:hypothetical protein